MTKLKIRSIGNSAGLILPKETLAHLGADIGDEVELTRSADGAVRLTPVDPEFQEQLKIAREGMKRYSKALRELAK